MKTPRVKVLRSVIPNVGIEAAYRRELEALVEDMCASVEYWVKAKYKNNAPKLAMDAPKKTHDEFEVADAWSVPDDFTGLTNGPYGLSNRTWGIRINGAVVRGKNGVGRSFASAESAAQALREALAVPADVLGLSIKQLADRWLKKFDEASGKLAKYFTNDVSKRTDARMKRILKDGGISVPFKMTQAQEDIAQATIQQNVALIKSIPQQYLTNVEGMVMRSVQVGGDVGKLVADLQKEFGVTKRRAKLIAIDQNNKATSAFQRARQVELGIVEAVWMHSYAGKEPRPTHVAMNGKRYDVTKGMWDPAVKEFIFPGQLINCRCTSKSVVAGLS